VDSVLDAFAAFFGHLGAIAWTPVLWALCCQLAKMAARSRAWWNILAAAYPQGRVRWRSVFGAYASGVGVNAVAPLRGGDVVAVALVKTRVEGATYTTLVASLLVAAPVDILISAALLAWAFQAGVLPGLDVVHRLPAIDWLWALDHPRVALVIAAAAVAAGLLAGVWASRRIAVFRRRVAQAFTILRTPLRYLRGVVFWQLLDWILRLATIVFFLRAFHVPATLNNALRVQVTHSVSTILPLTPAGIGTDQVLLVYVLAGQASKSALLSLSVGMKAIVSAANAVIGFSALFLMLRTLRWRSTLQPDAVKPQDAGQ
jgi:uncharacterized membrane protein YbhN (UPF0104 family)